MTVMSSQPLPDSNPGRMNLGVSPSIDLNSFFPMGCSSPQIIPGPDDRALWVAAGGGSCLWYERSEDPHWGRWATLLLVDEVSRSQFDGIRDFLRQGGTLPDRSACIALTGLGFHGQRNRPWSARPGNLHLVVHFSPHHSAKEIGLGFTLLPAVACIRAIHHLAGGTAAGIKWVNDIVVGRRKVGGFIVSTQTQGEIVRDAVLGMGINIDSAPEVEPTPFVPGVCCLDDFHHGISLSRFLPVLLRELHELYGLLMADGFMPLMSEYRRYAVVVGQSVRVWPETAEDSAAHLRRVPPLAQGRVAAIADDLSLILEGRQAPVTRGRLAEEASCRHFAL